jgi:hypothetical protein
MSKLIKLKLKPGVVLIKDKPTFKQHVYNQILSNIDGNINNDDCLDWTGYKVKHKHYDLAKHIVYFKGGRRHYLDPQKYIYNYLKFPNLSYKELISLKNRVRNVDNCKKRGICCCLKHIEEY